VADVLQLQPPRPHLGERIRLDAWLPGFIAAFVANESVPATRLSVGATREAWIEFDREHLHQVMWNLLRNAVRYARGEPRSVRVALGGFAGR